MAALAEALRNEAKTLFTDPVQLEFFYKVLQNGEWHVFIGLRSAAVGEGAALVR